MTALRFVALLMTVVLAMPAVAGAQSIPPPPPGRPPAPPPGVESGVPAQTPPQAQTPAPAVTPSNALAVTPARLSYVYGAVSFWRPGAENWAAAALNTPLAPGDALYVGEVGTAEIQVGPQAFIRAAAGTQIALDNQEAGFTQMRVPAGHVAIDAAGLARDTTIEVDTPNGAFTISAPGYYRADVTGESTSFAVHRGGQVSVTTASGAETAIAAQQQALIASADAARVELQPAPGLEAWDQWNQTRMAQLTQVESSQYVARGVYGAEALDQYGSWRVEESYGRVWVPSGVPAGWVPYSTGRWIWDPMFGWTWLDEAPWGWAPYHYGRWVFVRGVWAWAPGPVVVRPVYAPALVVFLGGVSVARPVYWAPLAWGEPVIPWWGRPGFVGVATWAGWGGPRVVNNVVVNRTTVNVTNITVYRNVQVTNAVIGVPAERFGHGDVRPVRVAATEVQGLRPMRGAPRVQPVAASVVPVRERGIAPPAELHGREVVATRTPHDPTPSLRAAGLTAVATDAPTRNSRIVASPTRHTVPERDVTPTLRERTDRSPDTNREPRGRQADVNREPRSPDTTREPRGRQTDVNRESRSPDATREPQGRQTDVNREPRSPDTSHEQRGRQADVNRESRLPDTTREPQGRQTDVNRQSRSPDANREQRSRPTDVNREPRSPETNREQRSRPTDVNREPRSPDANREQRGRPADVNRASRSPDTNREPSGRQVDPNRERQQRQPDVMDQRGRQVDVNQERRRPDDGQRRDDSHRGTSSRPVPDATRPPTPQSGQPGRPQQGDGSDDGKNSRQTPRSGPSSRAPVPAGPTTFALGRTIKPQPQQVEQPTARRASQHAAVPGAPAHRPNHNQK